MVTGALNTAVPVRPVSVALFAALLAAIIVAVSAGGTASAGTKAGPGHSAGHRATPGKPIISPRPGQRVKRNYLRLVVKSGPEREDLRAKLNGVQIGERFRVDL